MRTPGLNSTQRYGPVPLAVRKSLCPAGRIRKCDWASITGRSTFGVARRISTSCGPLARTCRNCSATMAIFDPAAGFLWRSRDQTTSSAVRLLPLWNSTPLRRRKRQRVWSSVTKLSAREVMEEVRRWNFGGGHVLHDQICFTRYASSNSCSSGPSFLALKCKTSSSRNRQGIHTYTLGLFVSPFVISIQMIHLYDLFK